MKKIKKQGFVLAEAIVVAVFVLGMFTYLAKNIIPLISEYDKALNYDNPQEVYAANILMDEMITYYNNYSSSTKEVFDYRILESGDFKIYFEKLKTQLNIEKIEFDKYVGGSYKKDCTFVQERASKQYCEYLFQKKSLVIPGKEGSYYHDTILCPDYSLKLVFGEKQSVLIKFKNGKYAKVDINVFKNESGGSC